MFKNAALFLALRATAIVAVAHNGGGWKKDDNGNLVVDGSGNPIWVDANGGEKGMDGGAITRLNGEAAALRKRAETAEGALSAFKGTDGKPIDPAIAVKAIETVSKLDAKKLIDAGEVDRVREQISQQFTGRISELEGELSNRDSTINNMRIDGVFQSSDFIRNNIAMPRDFFESQMRSHFKVDEKGDILAYDRNGNALMSQKNRGDFARGDEALELLVNLHPQKDAILKPNPHGGSGNQGNGGNRGGGNKISRADFEAMQPHEQSALAPKLAAREVTIVD